MLMLSMNIDTSGQREELDPINKKAEFIARSSNFLAFHWSMLNRQAAQAQLEASSNCLLLLELGDLYPIYKQCNFDKLLFECSDSSTEEADGFFINNHGAVWNSRKFCSATLFQYKSGAW